MTWQPEYIKILENYGQPLICPFVKSGGECGFKREKFDAMGGEKIFWPATADTGRGMFNSRSMCVPYRQVEDNYTSIRDHKVVLREELGITGIRIASYDENQMGLVEVLRSLNMIRNCLAFRYATHLPGFRPIIDVE